MKRLIGILSLTLLLVLSACSNQKISDNSIKPASLTDRESIILSATAEASFVFDYKADSDFKEVSVWVEKYESGELVDNQISHIINETEEEGLLIVAASKIADQNKNFLFTTSIGHDEESFSLTKAVDEMEGLENMAKIWGSFEEEMPLDDGVLTLGYLGFSSEENGISSLPDGFSLDMLKKYDVAYLIKAEFNK